MDFRRPIGVAVFVFVWRIEHRHGIAPIDQVLAHVRFASIAAFRPAGGVHIVRLLLHNRQDKRVAYMQILHMYWIISHFVFSKSH